MEAAEGILSAAGCASGFSFCGPCNGVSVARKPCGSVKTATGMPSVSAVTSSTSSSPCLSSEAAASRARFEPSNCRLGGRGLWPCEQALRTSDVARWVERGSGRRQAGQRKGREERRRVRSGGVFAEMAPNDGVRWWAKEGGANMKDIHSAQEFVDALSAAGERLVIVDFYATWCGSCRALYPKLIRLASEYDMIDFLKVNFDENKPLCKSLNVKVLPFFHFYRGASGRLEAFSASITKLQKLKDAIEMHNTDRCSLGPPLGLGNLPLPGVSTPGPQDGGFAPPAPETSLPSSPGSSAVTSASSSLSSAAALSTSSTPSSQPVASFSEPSPSPLQTGVSSASVPSSAPSSFPSSLPASFPASNNLNSSSASPRVPAFK